jgi:hypothetical protein
MIHRIGTFFMLLGVMLIVLFVLSDLAKTPACNLFFYGGFSIALGVFLWFRDPLPEGPPSGRFRLFKGGGKKGDKKPDRKP